MFKSACDVIKKSVVFSVFFLTVGAILEVAAQFLNSESMIPVYFAYAGVFAMFLGVLGLVVTFIAVLIPKVNQHLQGCQH